jgi:hypothetical protein
MVFLKSTNSNNLHNENSLQSCFQLLFYNFHAKNYLNLFFSNYFACLCALYEERTKGPLSTNMKPISKPRVSYFLN